MNAPALPPALWDFPYEPLPSREYDGLGSDLVVATVGFVSEAEFERAVGEVGVSTTFESLVVRAPLFWTRVRGSPGLTGELLLQVLGRAGIAVRYVAPATHASAIAAPSFVVDASMRARPSDWRLRERAKGVVDAPTASRWFLGPSGLEVDRARCGTGEGTRLAVVDDAGAAAELVGFEREIGVGVDEASRTSPHGSLMAGWAVGAAGAPKFPGVAPAASARLYAIPKPGIDVVSLARAIVRAVFDGADVVVCATYVEQTWSPMLDDALEVATRLGRHGRGAAIVFPCGREGSSPADSIHASWSLSLGDPASDPRVFCIGPSGRSEGWFLWRDRRGKLRPFANRGPAVRWLAPGDDLADPLELRDRWCHAESSGAAALAAGVLLLVLAANPKMSLRELDAVVTRTAGAIRASECDDVAAPAADPFDLLPRGLDADGHNAKHGYGRMNARRACLAARDPIAAALFEMGEPDAALAAFDLVSRVHPYSRRAARWIARRILVDARVSHGLKVVLRHLRLLSADPTRACAHAKGSLVRQIVSLSRELRAHERVPECVAVELRELERRLAAPMVESFLLEAASRLWQAPPQAARGAPAVAKNFGALGSKGGSVDRELA
jgi:subtilase family protein